MLTAITICASAHSKMNGIYRKTGRSGASGATVLLKIKPSTAMAALRDRNQPSGPRSIRRAPISIAKKLPSFDG